MLVFGVRGPGHDEIGICGEFRYPAVPRDSLFSRLFNLEKVEAKIAYAGQVELKTRSRDHKGLPLRFFEAGQGGGEDQWLAV